MSSFKSFANNTAVDYSLHKDFSPDYPVLCLDFTEHFLYSVMLHMPMSNWHNECCQGVLLVEENQVLRGYDI